MRLNSGFSSSPPAAQRFFVLFNSSDNSAAGGTAPDRPSHHPYVFELYETPTLQYFWTEGNRVMHHRDPIFFTAIAKSPKSSSWQSKLYFSEISRQYILPAASTKKVFEKIFFLLGEKVFSKKSHDFFKKFFFPQKVEYFLKNPENRKNDFSDFRILKGNF